jgi:hypothetical protein
LADIRKRESVKAAKQAEETKKRNAERLAKLQESITAWRNSEGNQTFYDIPAMLRITGNEVETSLGVKVPISHAKRALILVRAVVSRGEDWQTNGHTCHIGHYKLDRIKSDGTLIAGCHVISRQEWEGIAPALDAYTVTETEAQV